MKETNESCICIISIKHCSDDAELSLQAIVQYHQWSTMSAREIAQLQKDLAELENGLAVSDSTQQLRTELTNLRNKVQTFVAFHAIFQKDILAMSLSRRCKEERGRKLKQTIVNVEKNERVRTRVG